MRFAFLTSNIGLYTDSINAYWVAPQALFQNRKIKSSKTGLVFRESTNKQKNTHKRLQFAKQNEFGIIHYMKKVIYELIEEHHYLDNIVNFMEEKTFKENYEVLNPFFLYTLYFAFIYHIQIGLWKMNEILMAKVQTRGRSSLQGKAAWKERMTEATETQKREAQAMCVWIWATEESE